MPYYPPPGVGGTVAPGTYEPSGLATATRASLVGQGQVPTDPFPHPGLNRTLISAFQSGHGWAATTGGAGTNVNNTTSPVVGSQYATLETQGLGTGTPARITKTGLTVDLTNKTLWLLMRVTGTANLDNVQVYAGNSGFASYFYFQLDRYTADTTKSWFREGEWAWMPFGFESATASGTPDRSAVTDMRVTLIDHGGVVTADIAGLATTPNDQTFGWPNGVVSFTCDDGWASQFSAMRPVLDGYAFPATAYVIADAIDGTASLGGEGSMNLAQLKTLQSANRWEIASHALTLANHNLTFPAISDAALESEFAGIKQWLRGNGFTGSDHIAFPQGSYSPAVILKAKKYFTSARTTHDFGQETYPYGDRHRLRVLSLNSGVTLATAKAKVDACLANGTWLILVTHRLGATADSTTWVTSDFQALVDYIAARPIPVRTVGAVLAARGEEALRVSGGGRVIATAYPTVSPGVVNTVTETPIATLTVPAASVRAGDVLTFDVAWDAINNSGASVNYQYRLKVGAVTVGTTGQIAAGTSIQRIGARATFHIAIPQLATPRVWGEFTASFASGGFGGINTAHSGVLDPATPAVDFSSDVVVQLTCQMGTAAATVDFRPIAATVTRDRA